LSQDYKEKSGGKKQFLPEKPNGRQFDANVIKVEKMKPKIKTKVMNNFSTNGAG
jgi:hypothetical protein